MEIEQWKIEEKAISLLKFISTKKIKKIKKIENMVKMEKKILLNY